MAAEAEGKVGDQAPFTYRIADARRAKGWTQEQLASLVGVSQQAIQRYEAGKRDIRASMLAKLSAALDVTVAYLLGMADAEPHAVEVPLYGAIAAGAPLDMEPADELYPIPYAVHEQWPRAFLLRVEGESMNRILPSGCYALVDPCAEIDLDGQPYAVCVGGLAATVKRVRRLDNGYELVPDSDDPAFRPQVLANGDGGTNTVSVIGRVVWHCMPRDWRY